MKHLYASIMDIIVSHHVSHASHMGNWNIMKQVLV